MSSSKQRLGVWQAAEGGVVVRVHRRQQADCCRVWPHHLTVLAEESLVAVVATVGSGVATRLAELRTSGLARSTAAACRLLVESRHTEEEERASEKEEEERATAEGAAAEEEEGE